MDGLNVPEESIRGGAISMYEIKSSTCKDRHSFYGQDTLNTSNSTSEQHLNSTTSLDDSLTTLKKIIVLQKTLTL